MRSARSATGGVFFELRSSRYSRKPACLAKSLESSRRSENHVPMLYRST
jgi:hypothetical protein